MEDAGERSHRPVATRVKSAERRGGERENGREREREEARKREGKRDFSVSIVVYRTREERERGREGGQGRRD